MMQNEEFAERPLDFAVRIIGMCAELPKSYIAIHVKKQLLRSATSIGANYEEARGAGTDADFLNKMNISLKEARESLYWIKIIQRTNMFSDNRLNDLIKENSEICAIFVSSVKTIKNRIKG